jgi:hypothetical protein
MRKPPLLRPSVPPLAQRRSASGDAEKQNMSFEIVHIL